MALRVTHAPVLLFELYLAIKNTSTSHSSTGHYSPSRNVSALRVITLRGGRIPPHYESLLFERGGTSTLGEMFCDSFWSFAILSSSIGVRGPLLAKSTSCEMVGHVRELCPRSPHKVHTIEAEVRNRRGCLNNAFTSRHTTLEYVRCN